MTENLLQTLQHLIQDVIAPDVRETKTELKAFKENVDVRFDALEKHMDARFGAAKGSVDVRFDAVDVRFDALNEKIDAQFKVLLATLGEFRARTELANLQFKSEIGERLAALEARRQ